LVVGAGHLNSAVDVHQLAQQVPYATTDGQIRQKDVKISLAGTLTFAALRTAGVGVYTFDTFRGMLTYVATLPQSHPTAHVDLPWIPTTDPIFNK
jgi:hypothetical protein